MKDNEASKPSSYSFDLARMAEAVEGSGAEEVIVLSGPMTGAEIQSALHAAYHQLVTQEG